MVEELGKGEQKTAVDVEVAGPLQVAFRRITLRPGAGTGLHCHEGQLIALVEGADYEHQGKNEGTEDVVLLATYVIAKGEPLAQTDLGRCD